MAAATQMGLGGGGARTFMSDSSEGRSKGLPLKVVISPAMTTGSFLRAGTWYLRSAGVVAKPLVGCWVWQGGVLKTGLQVRSDDAAGEKEEGKQWAPKDNTRDRWRMHVVYFSCGEQEKFFNAASEQMQYIILCTD
jgi:hypothetical protein